MSQRRQAQETLRQSQERQNQERQSRARQNQERLAGIIASAMDAIVTVDGRQHILTFNPAAERMFGYAAQEVLGQPLGLLLPERFRERHREHVRAFGRAGSTNRSMSALGVLTAR